MNPSFQSASKERNDGLAIEKSVGLNNNPSSRDSIKEDPDE